VGEKVLKEIAPHIFKGCLFYYIKNIIGRSSIKEKNSMNTREEHP